MRKKTTIEKELNALFHFQKMLRNSIEVPKLLRFQRSELYVLWKEGMDVDKYIDGLADPRKNPFPCSVSFVLIFLRKDKRGDLIDPSGNTGYRHLSQGLRNEANRLISLLANVIKDIRG